jgi:tRNA-splicing ligase RtcB
MHRWFINLPDADLAYLPEGTNDFDDYVEAVGWAQDFAMANRQIMLRATVQAVYLALGREAAEPEIEAVNCHHNYVAKENHFGQNVLVTRKGAVRAREGDLGIIPGSMGARSFIVRGKGNPESFHSCSHGAGRKMSRGASRKAFTLADHEAATAGVECRKDEGVIDETPGSYKDIDAGHDGPERSCRGRPYAAASHLRKGLSAPSGKPSDVTRLGVGIACPRRSMDAPSISCFKSVK